jgi:hypothetical protein
MLSAILFLIAGFLLGHLIPRVPFMVLCRTSGFNKGFPPHPEPIPLSPRLTQRVLHMRWFHRLGTYTTFLPLLFGYLSILGGQSTFGYGLFLAGGWTLLSRGQALLGGAPVPCTLEMAQRLQMVMNIADSEDACCPHPQPQWWVESVRCESCSKKLEDMMRPDLGRPRKDGFFRGWLRLWLSEGRPMVVPDEPKN